MSMLAQPIMIGGHEIKNRLAMAPLAQEQSPDGRVNQGVLDYYDARTKGGHVGLVIIEHSYIRADGRAGSQQLSASSDEDTEGLSRLAALIHSNGSSTVMQLNHAGSSIKKDVVDVTGVSPSGLAGPRAIASGAALQDTRPMTEDDIREIAAAFANAADRAKRAGFDGVEIHAAHGYLLNQFFSPVTNKRTDNFGVTVEGRTRAAVMAVRAVKERVGEGFIVGVRLGGCDYMAGGSTIDDAVAGARMLEDAGAQFIDLTGGMCGYTPEGRSGPGYFGDMGSAVKAVVSVPVLLAGGVMTGADAESVLERGAADIVSVGRAIMKNPGWAGELNL